MIHFLEELWRFKALGIPWAISIALLIVGLREFSKSPNEKTLMIVRVISVIALILGFLLFISALTDRNYPPQTEEDENVETKQDSDIFIKPDSMAEPSFDSVAPVIQIDTNKLTRDFVIGNWNVVSEDSTINEDISFKYNDFDNVRIINECINSRIVFCNHPIGVPYYKIFSTNGYHEEATLRLEKDGGKMKGLLTISDDGTYSYARPIKISNFKLIFTRK